MALPPQGLLEDFEPVIQPMFDQIRVIERKNVNLRAQRDLQLPKLVSGEIDLSGAQAELEAAE